MKKSATFTHVEYYGGHPEYDKAKEGMVVLVDDDGVHLKSMREKFCIPWASITALEIEGPEQAAKRVTVTRVLALGVFALAAKKDTSESFLHVETASYSVGFMIPKVSAAELRTSLAPWKSRVHPTQSAPAPVPAPSPPPPPPQPAAWHPDPSGRHELRYFDGSAWTHHVSDRGATAIDPLP